MEKATLNIKDRVLEISDFYGIKRADFFKSLNVSYANFKGIQRKTSLNSDTIEKILTKYENINSDWLIFGRGAMFKSETINNQEKDSNISSENTQLIDINNQLKKNISILEKTILICEERINDKSKIIEDLEFKVFMLENNKNKLEELYNLFTENKAKRNNSFWISEEGKVNKTYPEL